MEMTVRCKGCGGYAVIKNLSLNYKCSDVLKKLNYFKYDGFMYCANCHEKIMKKAG